MSDSRGVHVFAGLKPVTAGPPKAKCDPYGSGTWSSADGGCERKHSVAGRLYIKLVNTPRVAHSFIQLAVSILPI
jgi:hypothetical protein